MRFLIYLFFVILSFRQALADLHVGFYSSSCPQAESIVQEVVARRFGTDKSVAAGLLRLYFHDCFVTGCDASIMITSTRQYRSEKAAGPNRTVRGYDIINEVKAALEAQCPSTVSCADIIALATRDAVTLAGGLNYSIPTGRRDGIVSKANDVNLPGPTSSISDALQYFTAKNFTLEEMVVLMGGHTIGVAHCGSFRDELGDYPATGASPMPNMDQGLRAKLWKQCGSRPRPLRRDPTAFLDQNTSLIVDNEYYKQIMMKKGILQVDQNLAADSSTSPIIESLASDNAGFLQKFADVLVKLGNVEVLVGNAGQIRKKCWAFNRFRHSKAVHKKLH